MARSETWSRLKTTPILALNQPSYIHSRISPFTLDLLIFNPLNMCFPCSTYEDVYFEPRPRPHKVNKHPHAGTIYAGYHTPRPMALAPLSAVVLPSPVVPVTHSIVPALLPMAPTGRPAATPVSDRHISSCSVFPPIHNSSLFSSLPYAKNSPDNADSIHFLLGVGQPYKRSSHFFKFYFTTTLT
jgi:hypothetical protein